MRNIKETVETLMSSLIEGRYGCIDAAHLTLNERLDTDMCRGTLYKKASGSIIWGAHEIAALEDGASRYPVTNYLYLRKQKRLVVPGSLMDHAGSASKESGEGVSAIIQAQQTSRREDKQLALKEAYEARDAWNRAIAALESSE